MTPSLPPISDAMIVDRNWADHGTAESLLVAAPHPLTRNDAITATEAAEQCWATATRRSEERCR